MKELLKQIEFYRTIFKDYIFWIEDARKEVYEIRITEHSVWIEKAQSLWQNEYPMQFPVQIHTGKYPPLDCIRKMYLNANTSTKLGRWFMEKFDKSNLLSDLYWDSVNLRALQKIKQSYYQV